MSHLTASQLEELKSELERQVARLATSMQRTDEALKPVELDQTAVGRLSRMNALQNQGLTKNLREREQVRLGLLLAALESLEEGSYGVCRTCTADVPFERLIVFPEAPTCAKCA